MSEKKVRASGVLRSVTPLVYNAAPFFFWLFLTVTILHGLSWAVKILYLQKFYDTVSEVIKTGGEIKTIYISLIVYGVIIILAQVLNGLNNFLFLPFNQKCIGKLMQKVHLKIAKMPAIQYENASTLDSINKAEMGINNIFNMVFSFIMLTAFFLPYVLFMGIWIFTIKPILAIVIVISMMPCLLTKILQVGMYSKLEDEVAALRRSFDYYEGCICSKEYFKETRILGATNYFKRLYYDAMAVLNKKSLKVGKRACVYDLAGKFIGLAGYLAVLLLFVNALLSGDITAGTFAAIFTAIAKMQEMLGNMINLAGDISKNSGSIYNLLEFLDMPETDGTVEIKEFCEKIQLKNVSFRYPEAKEKSLKDIDLTIHKGETIAIVGHNGAGKSTLVRMITGIYRPTEGSVIIDGTDIKGAKSASLFRIMSGVFQKFQKYQMTLRENIMISDMNCERSDEDILAILKKADVDMNSRSYIDGLDTMLSREFDGVDLSGGQWQRISIARGINRDSKIIVLDEPTAAIDPIEETRIYKKFKEISNERTTILVTHRMGSARIADKIVVMENGRVAEMGTHDELMDKKGTYFDLFMSQAQWYENQEVSFSPSR